MSFHCHDIMEQLPGQSMPLGHVSVSDGFIWMFRSSTEDRAETSSRVMTPPAGEAAVVRSERCLNRIGNYEAAKKQ